MAGIKNLPWVEYVVAFCLERSHHLSQEILVLSDREALYVFEHETASIKLGNNPNKVLHQTISRIINCSVTYQGKALAWGAAKYAIDALLANARSFANIRAGYLRHRMRDYGGLGKIVLVRSAMDRIDFDCRGNIESRLLKAEA